MPSLERLLCAGFGCGLSRVSGQDIGLTAGVAGQQGMLAPLRHLTLSLTCLGVHVCPTLNIVFLVGIMRMITIRYLLIFIFRTLCFTDIKLVILVYHRVNYSYGFWDLQNQFLTDIKTL